MPVNIIQLPINILLRILCKMNNKELCNLRKTCHALDKFAEDHRRTLISRSVDCDNFNGFTVNVELASDGKAHILYNNSRHSRLTNSKNLKNNFSGITIVHLRLQNEVVSLNDSVFQKFVARLQEAEISCGNLWFTNFPAKYVVQAVEIFKCRGAIDVRYTKEDFTQAVTVLNTSPRRAQFQLCDLTGKEEIGDFALVKHFRQFSQKCSPNTFCSLLRTMKDNEDTGNIVMIMSIFHGIFPDDLDLPPFELLWTIPAHQPQQRNNELPKRCRLFRLTSKWVMNIEYNNSEMVRLCDSSLDALSYVAAALRFTVNDITKATIGRWNEILLANGDLAQAMMDDFLVQHANLRLD